MKTFYKIMALAFAVVMISQVRSFAQTTYYFSRELGADDNNPGTIGSPKKSVQEAVSLMTGGNIIKFRRGDIWYIPMETMTLTGKSNFTIDAYGSGAKPVIAGMIHVDSTQFTAVPGYTNVYKYESPDTINRRAHRVFVNGVSRISLVDKHGNDNIMAHLDSTDEYKFDPGQQFNPTDTGAPEYPTVLYLKMPSAARPHNVEINPGTQAKPNGWILMRLQNSNNVTIRNVELRGGGKWTAVFVHAPCRNITFDSCIISRSSYSGLGFSNEVKNMDVVRKCSVINCIIDKGWTLAENNINIGDVLGGDGIGMMHGVDSCVIKGNFIRNWGHSAIQMSTFLDSFGVFGVKHNKIEQNDIASGNSGYMHAFDISGYKNLTTLNIIKRNYFHDFNSACNLSGNNNFIFANIFARITVSKIPRHSHQPHGGQLYPWIKSGKRMDGRDNWVINNTFYKMEGCALNIGQSCQDTTTVKGNKVINNVMMNYGEDTTYALDDNKPGHFPNVALRISMWKESADHDDGIPPGDIVIRNNNFYVKDSASTKRVALYGSRYYNASTLNLCPEGGSRVTGNRWFNPLFDSWWGYTSASPVELREGGAVYAIENWGLPAGEFVDYFGDQWDPVKPSIGAVQYFPEP